MGLKGIVPTPQAVGKQLGTEKGDVEGTIHALVREGSLKKGKGGLWLTKKGRGRIRVVFIGGGFEVIHRGHLYTVEESKKLGDVLVVSVARDSTIRKRKKREPVSAEEERVRLLSSLRQVDAAILGVEGDIYDTLERVRPDVVALGYDQYHMESQIEEEGKKRGMNLEVVRLRSPFPEVKTTGLLEDY